MLDRLGMKSLWRIALLVLGAAVVLLASYGVVFDTAVERAWTVSAGFLLLTVSMLGASRATVVPVILAVTALVFAGFSSVVAVPESIETAAARAQTLDPETVKAVTPAEGFVSMGDELGFDYAMKVTGPASLAMVLASLIAAGLLAAPGTRRRRRPFRIEAAGKSLVALGFLGVAVALIRFAMTQFPTDDLFASFKSFWLGGTYFLVLGTFSVTGFGFWWQGLVGRKAAKREYLWPALLALLYLVLLVPTGQRGFAVAIGLIALAILVGNRVVGVKGVVALVLAGVFAIGLTQGIRNEASGTGKITVQGSLDRMKPDQWKDLYSSQIASFSWTMLIEQNRDKLDIPNSFIEVLGKPVPRSIYPDKSQGFGNEFTMLVFPDAVEQDVSFATPLVAESDYNFGPVGAVIALALLGLVATIFDRRVAQRAPPLVEPIVVATIFWTCFELVRGDLANALTFSAGWLIPLIIFSLALGLRKDPPLKRAVIDALQVAPRYSGIGRRMVEIGEGLKRSNPGLPVEVRCARDVVDELRAHFPPDTRFRTPLSSSRPRWRRILFQQLVAPLLTGPATLVIAPGDQAPAWGRSPLLFVIHDVRRLAAPETAASGLERLFYRTTMKAGARRSAAIITISGFSRKEIELQLNPECPILITSSQPEGIEPVPAAELRENEPLFLLVGALRSYKGTGTVIEALSKAGPDVRVACVGAAESEDGVTSGIRSAIDRAGVGDRFEMLGWVEEAELKALYRRAAGSINPSEYEGYGLTVTESLAAGLPTLASDIPPHRETAGEAGLYFQPSDTEQLAALMLEIAGDSARREEQGRLALQRHEELSRADSPWEVTLAEAIRLIGESRQDEPVAGPTVAATA